MSKVTFGKSISSCYSKYATFSGRARRSEYWFFSLYHFLLVLVASFFIQSGMGIVLICILFAVNFLPHLSVLVRRLHDTDHSGWWVWLPFVPIVGPIILIIWLCTRGTEGENRFGPILIAGDNASRPLSDKPESSAESPAMFDTSDNKYCVSCGQSAMQTFRICPSCGGREFTSNPQILRT